MAKKVLTTESCVITSDDKKSLSLVGKAKEALTTLAKNKIEVTILLDKVSKEDAEKFLKENNVPYKALAESDKSFMDLVKGMDAVVIPDAKFVTLGSDWTWALNGVVDKLFDNREKQPEKSEQAKMDDKFKTYKHWADEANAARKKMNSVDPVA